MRYTREELAEKFCEDMRRIRLERIGMLEEAGPGAPFDKLPQDEQQNWLDMADVAIEIFLRVAEDHTDHGGLPHGPLGDAVRAAHDALEAAGVKDPALILVVEADRPGETGWGRSMVSTVANPLDTLRLIMPQIEEHSRGESQEGSA